jgi:hypothetical protein
VNPDTEQRSDETNTADPAAQLAEAHQKIAQMSRDLDDLQVEQRLTHKLAAAGAIDLETAVLVAKARIQGQNQADLDGCIAQLRKEKVYLFGGSPETAAPRKTAGVKGRTTATRQAALEQAAQKAAQTGSRTDLYHYLRLRRNLL